MQDTQQEWPKPHLKLRIIRKHSRMGPLWTCRVQGEKPMGMGYDILSAYIDWRLTREYYLGHKLSITIRPS